MLFVCFVDNIEIFFVSRTISDFARNAHAVPFDCFFLEAIAAGRPFRLICTVPVRVP